MRINGVITVFSLLIAAYVPSTGIFFLANVLFDTSIVSKELSSKIIIARLGVLFAGFGLLYIFLGWKGRLKISAFRKGS